VDAATLLITEAFSYHSNSDSTTLTASRDSTDDNTSSSSTTATATTTTEDISAPDDKVAASTSNEQQSSLYLQTRLLEALEELSRSPHSETRHRMLESLHSILQSSGQGFLQVRSI
jgi:hypothetical protein